MSQIPPPRPKTATLATSRAAIAASLRGIESPPKAKPGDSTQNPRPAILECI